MSGIGGVWLEAGPDAIDPSLERMLPGLRRRGRGRPSRSLCGPVGMIRCGAAAGDAPPPVDPASAPSGVLLGWDGRLDNAEALRRKLRPDAPRPNRAELIVAGYRRWGADVVRHLRGDFALALWDPAEQCLLLGRDGAGARPLFYHRAPGRTVWASTLTAVLAAAELTRRLDHDWLAAYFTLTSFGAATPDRGIRCVPPGCFVVITGAGERRQRHWVPGPGAPFQGQDAEFEEGFVEVFTRAVARRLDAPRIAVDLSGGLDSSSIAVVAGALIGAGETPARELLTVSFLYGDSLTADETDYIDRVEQPLDGPTLHLEQEDHPIFAEADTPFYELPGMKVCLRAREEALVNGIREYGARVQLRGVGGDHLLWSEVSAPVWLADLLRRGRLRRLGRELGRWSRGEGRSYLPLLWAAALEPLLPLPLRLRSERRRSRIPAWLRPRWVRAHGLEQRLRWERELGLEDRPCGLREHLVQIDHAINVAAWAYDRGPLPLDIAYPYLDRDLIEFCLALPPDQLARPGESRSIQRRALRHLLPPQVAQRRTKGSMVEPFMRAYARSWPRIESWLSTLRLADLGIVDPVRLGQALKRARYGLSSEPLLMHALGLELWLRSLEQPAE